jgi:hypothetical protein
MNKYNEILLKEAVDKFFNITISIEEKQNLNMPINLYKLVKLFNNNKNLHDADVQSAILHMPSKRQVGEEFTFYKQRLKLRGIFVNRRNLFFQIKTEE